MTSPVHFVVKTSDRKLAPIVWKPYLTPRKPGQKKLSPQAAGPYCSSTYVSIEATCPDHCVFKAGACYVRGGFTGGRSANLDAAARDNGWLPDEVALLEAAEIKSAFRGGPIPQDGARGGRDLRLHTGGDVPSTKGARLLAAAARNWLRRGGGAVWTFTKRWREIPRKAFGVISALASVETLEDAKLALDRGYAPAIVLNEHLSHRAEVLNGIRVIPCPAETRGTTCIQCRLCLNAPALVARRAAIAFALHGGSRSKVQLPVLRRTQ